MATHSSVLAWRIPGMGEPGGLPSMGSHRVGHDWSDAAAAAKLSRVSRIRLSVTPEMAAHQAPPSLGFSRQEHWSGLPFPLQCMKVKSLSRVRLFATPWTAAYQAPPSTGWSTGVGCHCLLLMFLCTCSINEEPYLSTWITFLTKERCF